VLGWNRNGQVGDGTTTDRLTPTDVSGLATGFAAVEAALHSCALNKGGGVKCWGFNASGQRGDGTTTDRLVPVDVVGLGGGVIAITAGIGPHTCALTSEDGVKCWGDNSNGQLGDGTTTTRPAPVDVSGLSSGIAGVSAGWLHTCAVTTTGGVKCWGDNLRGQLGDGTTTDRAAAVDVVGLSSPVVAVASGSAHSCALTTAGAVKCWGANTSGQLGNGGQTDSPTPVDVSSFPDGVAAIAAGSAHTCALTKAGAVTCWGINTWGQLGDGTTWDRSAPVQVVGLQASFFTDHPLMAGTPVRAAHVTELRHRLDDLRSRYALPAFAWSDPLLDRGVSIVKAVHVLELRTALAEAYGAAGQTPPTWGEALVAGATTIRGTHVFEVRAGILAIW